MYMDKKSIIKVVITTLILTLLITNIITFQITKNNYYNRGILIGMVAGWQSCETKDPNSSFEENIKNMILRSKKINEVVK